MACQEKAKPIINKDKSLKKSIPCLKLSIINQKDEFTEYLNTLYPFSNECNYTLTLSYKKDIVCNSRQNISMKTKGKFPKSFLRLEVRKGLNRVYSYYVDLYNNVNKADVEEGFKYLKKDLLKLIDHVQ